MRRSNPGIKALDSAAGSAAFGLCRVWGALRRLSSSRYRRPALPEPEQVRAVLVIKLCCLGDAILTIPAIRALKMHFPNARVSVLTTPRSCDAYVGQPCIDEVNVARLTGLGGLGELLRRGLTDALRSVRAARRARPDIAIDLDLYFKATPLLAFLSGAPIRVGFDTEGCHRAGLYTHSAPRQRTQHELLCFLDVVGAIGVKTDDTTLMFPLSDADRADGQSALAQCGVPTEARLVALCPGSSKNWPQKQWPAESFARVGDYLAERLGAQVVLIGTSHELAVHEQVRGAMSHPAVSLAGTTTVGATGAVLSRCELLVTNDTGPLHLAAALDVPTVAIFGPTDDRKWRPWHARSRVVRSAACDRAPCYWLSSMPDCPDVRCLSDLPPETVIAAAKSLLAEIGAEVATGDEGVPVVHGE
jgi:heptosyltransferase II